VNNRTAEISTPGITVVTKLPMAVAIRDNFVQQNEVRRTESLPNGVRSAFLATANSWASCYLSELATPDLLLCSEYKKQATTTVNLITHFFQAHIASHIFGGKARGKFSGWVKNKLGARSSCCLRFYAYHKITAAKMVLLLFLGGGGGKHICEAAVIPESPWVDAW